MSKENPNAVEKALFILEKTNDGTDLSPEHLKLVETAVNGWLSESGEVAFDELYKNVKGRYKKPWFHGIEHLTIDYKGYVYWKGSEVEHYTLSWAYSDEAKKAAQELARRCRLLEARGVDVSTRTVVWDWKG